MNPPSLTSIRRALAGGILAALGIALLNAQTPSTGTIEGRVLNDTSGNDLNNVRIAVKDTRLEAATNENGEYRIAGVPAGQANISAVFTGLTPQTRAVTISAGQTSGQRGQAETCNEQR